MGHVFFNENEWMDKNELSSIIEGKKLIKMGICIIIITIIIINLLFKGTNLYVYSYGLVIIGLVFCIDGIKEINKTKKEAASKLNCCKEICDIINDPVRPIKEKLKKIDKSINETTYKHTKPKKINYLLRRYCLDRKWNFEVNSKSYYIRDIEGMYVFFYDGRNKIYDLGYGNKYASITLLPEFGFCDWLIEKGFIDCDKLKKGIQWENYNIKNVGDSLIYKVNTLYYNLFLIDAEHIASFDYNNGTDKKFEYLESLLY